MKNKNNYYIHSKLLPLHKISLQIVILEERHLYFSIFFYNFAFKKKLLLYKQKNFIHANRDTFVYFDPPYHPLSNTSSFNDYTKEPFNDDAQIRLKKFCNRVNNAGYKFMLSNSDCKKKNEDDNFFDILYSTYKIERV